MGRKKGSKDNGQRVRQKYTLDEHWQYKYIIKLSSRQFTKKEEKIHPKHAAHCNHQQ
jgi:hypothetical protein